MRVARAARRFDRTPCLDAYTGQLAFMGQLGLYDDSRRDNEAGERRVISTGPESVIPARRVVRAAGLPFIIGHANPDTYRGQAIRIGYVAHEATALAKILTPGQACRGEPGRSAYAAIAWIKNSADDGDSSTLSAEHNIHFSATENVPVGGLVSMAGNLHIARLSRIGPAGTRIVFADELDDDALTTVSVATGSWNPLNETFDGGSQEIPAIRLRWQSLFQYQNTVAPKFGPGDFQLVIAKAHHTPRAGQRVGMPDGSGLVGAVADEGDVWICKVTRNA